LPFIPYADGCAIELMYLKPLDPCRGNGTASRMFRQRISISLWQIKQRMPGKAYDFSSRAGEARRFQPRRRIMRKIIVLGALVAALGFAGSAGAAEVEVKMLNKGTEGVMVFEPALVKFVASDKGHNVETVDAMVPEGGQKFVGKINEELAITFDKPGVYGYKCKPHYGMGMVGMIVVGDAANVDQAKAATHPGKAKQAFANLFDKLATTTTAAK
jgi:pseudoazurin